MKDLGQEGGQRGTAAGSRTVGSTATQEALEPAPEFGGVKEGG